MGIAYVEGIVRRGRAKPARMRFMVDTGALYTVLPAPVWRTLALKPMRTLEFMLADGTIIARELSECRIELAGRAATSPVVLGEPDDAPLLGTVTLETLGLMVNPLTRRLVPIGTLPLGALALGNIRAALNERPGELRPASVWAQSPSIFAM